MNSRANVISIITETVNGIKINETQGDTNQKLSDLGIDSLDIAGIFLGIQEKLGISIPDDDMDELDTIEKIVKYIDAKVA